MPCIRRAFARVCTLVVLAAAVACAGSEGVGTETEPSGSVLTVRLSPKADSLGVGETRRFVAQVIDQAGIPRTATVAWMSINNTIATVSASGDVTALAPGLVGIVATIGTSADTASLYIREGQLVVEPNAITTAVGEELQLSASTRAGVAASGASLTWKSSDESVAVVSSDGTLTAVGAGDATLLATAGTQTGSAVVSVKARDVGSLRVTPTTSTVYPNATTTLVATAYDDAGRVMALGSTTPRWSSSNTAIATVSDDGVVTGKARGSAIITARISSKAATATVNVLDEPVSSVAVGLEVSTLEIGQTTQASATLKDGSGTTLTGRTVAWQSSNPAISTVNSSGTVTAVARGSATISAIADGKVGGAPLTVAAKTVASVVVAPNPASATVGQSAQLTATIKDAAGVAMTGRTITWASNNVAVATVSTSGLVTAVSAGSATISATADGVTGQASFATAAVTAASVAITPNAPSVQAGQYTELTATAYDAAGAALANRVPTWSSSNPAIATVSGTGRLTGVAAGTANITATVDGKSATVGVAVTAPPPAAIASIAVVLHNPTVTPGQTTWAQAEARDASGKALTGKSVAWSSAMPTLATVSQDGTVTTISSGSVSIVATAEGVTGASTLIIGSAAPAAVATVSLSATSTSMFVGQSQLVAVTLRDAAGNTLSGRTIGFSSSNLGVITVSPSGQVTAVGAGSATVTATSEGKSGAITLSVTTAPVAVVASVTVSGTASSLDVGQTSQLSATARDAGGSILGGRTVTWTSSAPSIASVSATGVVTANAAGTSVINATVSGVVGSLPMTVNTPVVSPPPPPPTGSSIATPPELPRATPSFNIPAPTRIVNVTAGMDLQAALDNAQRGDELRLSGTFTGNFYVRSCGAGWITVRGSASVPAVGTRVTPAMAASYAKIVTNNTEAALQTAGPACRWAFVGLEIVGTLETTQYLAYGIIRFGNGAGQSTTASIPTDFALTHSYVHGSLNHNNTRCVVLNSANTMVRDSWISECHARGSDSQAIEGWNGPGPFLIENNRLEGAGENIMFGGADPSVPGLIPSDITIRRNHIIKPLTWRGGPWSIKNLLELKNAQRVLIEANVMENSWPASQEGMAVVIKSATDACQTCTWEGSTDVTLRWNEVKNAAVGLNLQAIDNSPGTTNTVRHVARVSVTNNAFTDIGAEGRAALMMFTHDLSDVSIANNTFLHHSSVGTSRGAAVIMDYGYGSARRMEWRGNLMMHGAYGVFYNGQIGSAAIQGMVGDGSYAFSSNNVVFGGEYASKYPTGNTWLSSVPSSTLVGVDRSLLSSRISGVVVSP
jgi:uncharacterized protein YjdB